MLLVLHTTHIPLYYTFFLPLFQEQNGQKTNFLSKSLFSLNLERFFAQF